VITRGIETMVDTIQRLDLGETSSAAKTLETLSALAFFFTGGFVVGVIIFGAYQVARSRQRLTRSLWPGAAGVPVIVISLDIGVAEEAPSFSVVWLAVLFASWGAALQWTFERLHATTPATATVETVEPLPITAKPLSRREFLIRVGGATATLTVVGAAVGRYLEVRDERAYQELVADRRAAAEAISGTLELPNQNDPVVPAPGTRPEYTPLEDHYRIDINVRPSEIDSESWRLRIHGQVKKELALSLDELRDDFDPMNRYVTLACISNPVGGDLISTTLWTGASLRDVLERAGLKATATHVKITSADGFYETVAIKLIYSADV